MKGHRCHRREEREEETAKEILKGHRAAELSSPGPGCLTGTIPAPEKETRLQTGGAPGWGGGGEDANLIKHFLAGQAGSYYSAPQRTVHVPLFEGILQDQRCVTSESYCVGRRGRSLVWSASHRGNDTDPHRTDVWTGVPALLSGSQCSETESALNLEPGPRVQAPSRLLGKHVSAARRGAELGPCIQRTGARRTQAHPRAGGGRRDETIQGYLDLQYHYCNLA